MALDTKERVTPEGQATDDAFDAIMSHPDNTDLRDKLNESEQSPDQKDAADENPYRYAADSDTKTDNQRGKKRGNGNWKKIGLGGGLAGGGILAVFSFFSFSVAPMALIQPIIADLNTVSGSLLKSHESLFKSRLNSKSSSASVKGCTIASIRCKFGTMTKAQAARYERAGFKVTGEEVSIGTIKRLKVSSLEFQGTKYTDPKEYNTAKASNKALRVADTRANNMRYLSTKTGQYANAVLKRFNITKLKPGLSGSKADRVNQLLTAAGTTDAKELKFTKVTDKDGNPTRKYKLEGDTSGKVYTETEVAEAQKAVASRPTVSKLQGLTSSTGFKTLAGAMSIIGGVDMACSVYNMIGATAVAAKLNTQVDLIRFAQPIAALVQSIMVGDETGVSENLAAVGEIATKVDTRKQVWQGDKLVDNPNYNQSALTSPLVQMSTKGTLPSLTQESLQFTSGLSVEKLLGGAGEIYTMIQQNITKEGCAIVQNWFVRGAGLVVGVIAMLGSGGSSLLLTAGTAIAVGAAMYTLQAALTNAIQGPDLVTAFEDGSTEAVGSALWLGLAAETGAHAQSAGLVPGNTDEILEYQSVQNQANNDYAELEKEDGQKNPFDITNQYSFLGAAARQFGSATNYGNSPVAIMTGVVKLAMGNTVDTASATVNISSARFEQCGDTAYEEAGVNADAGCNLRYIMMPEDTEKLEQTDSAESIAQWMEDQGYVDKDTTTGLPIGYVPIDPAQAQNVALQFITSTVAGFVGQFYNTRVAQLGTGVAAEYGKFLDYCAYRTMPFGEQFAENSAINGVDEGWITGAKCREHSEEISYFRVYTNLVAANAAEDEDTEVPATSSSQAVTGASGTCAANTKNLGVYDQAHDNGQQISVVLCELTSINLQPGFYTDQDPAIFHSGSGGTIVGASVSDAFQKLGEAAKAEGRQLVGKGIRSYEKQEYFYNCYITKSCNNGNLAAKPGESNHENGTAVDFVLGSGDLEWLRANGGKFGLKELTGGSQPEPWHWSPTGQ